MNQHQSSTDAHRDWVNCWLVNHLEIKPEELDPNENLLMYGMDSVNAIMLVGDLESHFELRLPPTLVWDHPTINTLVDIVKQSISEKSPAPADSTTSTSRVPSDGIIDQEQAAKLLENIDQLSEAEVDQLLKKLAAE